MKRVEERGKREKEKGEESDGGLGERKRKKEKGEESDGERGVSQGARAQPPIRISACFLEKQRGACRSRSEEGSRSE